MTGQNADDRPAQENVRRARNLAAIFTKAGPEWRDHVPADVPVGAQASWVHVGGVLVWLDGDQWRITDSAVTE